ncbi:hypothetical protein C8Q76DRAFT_792675 [Earliella scabrosa]|nr:hypothetical protein C8Q76DRAFT_792675 [Earliella scabrosa]
MSPVNSSPLRMDKSPAPSHEEAAAKLDRQRALRQARNRRYRNKVKQLKAEPCRAATTQRTHSPGPEARLPAQSTDPFGDGLRNPRRPVPVPPSPDYTLTNNLGLLNDRLEAWGFCPEPRYVFATAIQEELEQASTDPEARKRWVSAKEDWIEEGDRILDAIEDVICGETLEHMCNRPYRHMYRILCSVAIKVQYMIVVVEVTLDSCT